MWIFFSSPNADVLTVTNKFVCQVFDKNGKDRVEALDIAMVFDIGAFFTNYGNSRRILAIQPFLMNPIMEIVFNEHTCRTFHIKRSPRQTSILGRTLFLILINDLFVLISSNSVFIIMTQLFTLVFIISSIASASTIKNDVRSVVNWDNK